MFVILKLKKLYTFVKLIALHLFVNTVFNNRCHCKNSFEEDLPKSELIASMTRPDDGNYQQLCLSFCKLHTRTVVLT